MMNNHNNNHNKQSSNNAKQNNSNPGKGVNSNRNRFSGYFNYCGLFGHRESGCLIKKSYRTNKEQQRQ